MSAPPFVDGYYSGIRIVYNGQTTPCGQGSVNNYSSLGCNFYSGGFPPNGEGTPVPGCYPWRSWDLAYYYTYCPSGCGVSPC